MGEFPGSQAPLGGGAGAFRALVAGTYHEAILDALDLQRIEARSGGRFISAAEGLAEGELKNASAEFRRTSRTVLARSPDFSIRVKMNYRFSCAFCGFRSLLGSDHFGLEAAHIHWKSEGGPDTLENGFALCRLHHAAFDFGILGVDEDGKVLVSKRFVPQDPVSEGQVGGIAGKTVATAKDVGPSAGFLGWHRKEIFDGEE